jgi:hypothetical protein
MKPALILSHLGTLAVGAAAAYLVVPSLKSSKESGPAESAGAVTTFAGGKGGGESGDPGDAAGSLSAVRLEQTGYKMGSEDPLAAIAAAKKIPGRDNRYLYTESVFTAWGEKNGLEAANWVLANLKGVEKSDALYNIADGWAESDPAAAALWFNENTSGVNREDAIYEILESWGRKSPDAALAWAEKLDDYTRSSVMDSLAEGWAAKDPQGAAKASEKLLEYDFGDEFVMNVAGQWASTNPAEAAAWAGTIGHTDARAIAHLEIGTEWAMDDPSKATEWINSLGTDEDKLYASLGVALGWSEHDPGAALGWAVGSVQNPETRQRIIEDVMLDWSSTDPTAAAEWLNGQPKGPQNDEVLATFSSAIIDIDPESAVTWASTISDEGKRGENLNVLLEEWIAMDGDSARKWVAGSKLSDDLKKKYGPQN